MKHRAWILLIVTGDLEFLLKALFSYLISEILELDYCEFTKIFIDSFKLVVNDGVLFS